MFNISKKNVNECLQWYISALTCIIGYVNMQHNVRDYKGKKSYH